MLMKGRGSCDGSCEEEAKEQTTGFPNPAPARARAQRAGVGVGDVRDISAYIYTRREMPPHPRTLRAHTFSTRTLSLGVFYNIMN